MFFILFLLFSFVSKSISVTCNPENKKRYGKNGETKIECLNYAGCWDDNYGCYFSNEVFPGFHMMMGECTTCPIELAVANLTRNECAGLCLKRSTCNCFTYDSITEQCQMKKSVCATSNFALGSKITYNKHASKDMICSYGLCPLGNILEVTLPIQSCNHFCGNDPSCKMIGLKYGNNFSPCMVKNYLCNFFSPEKQDLSVISCIRGPILPDWRKNHETGTNKITDNSNSTCKSISSTDNFNLIIPWPTLENDRSEFELLIIGKNLKKCMNLTNSIDKHGLVAYVEVNFDSSFQFLGSFKSCHLISGNDNEICQYSCSCGDNYCQAVHIRAFNAEASDIEICNYKIL